MRWELIYTFSILSIGYTHAFTQRSWDDASRLANQTVSLMTLDEKLGIVIGVGWTNPERRCVGTITPPSRSFPVEGLNVTIPALCMSDGPAGLRLIDKVTGFPSGINTASTFNRRLMRARGEAIGTENRVKGSHIWLGPATDLMRNPLMGRGWESFGPDPYLAGETTFETIVGVQSAGVQAVAKHFAANNQEHSRFTSSSEVDDRTFHELYYWPYHRAIDANVSSVMCSYNRINQTYSCQNEHTIGPNATFRKEGFRGFVVSDWGATHNTAAENAFGGLQMEQPGDLIGADFGGGIWFGGNLKNAINNGSVPVSLLDDMVTHILSPWFRLGQDQDFPATNFDVQRLDFGGPKNENVDARSEARTALVREIGAASAVLLKNVRNTEDEETTRGLPLSQSQLKSIAIIGQDAKQLTKNCSLGLNTGANTCNDGTMVIGWGSGAILTDFVIPPVEAIASFVGDSANVTTSLTNDLDAGAEAASGKDVAIVFVNAMSGELLFEGTLGGISGDRDDLDLWYNGSSLVQQVAAVNPNTVVVVHSVGPVRLDWSTHSNITAIIYAGAPGEQTGPSIVDVLWGAVNPSGRLPFSIADSEEDYGTEIVRLDRAWVNINYTEGLFIDYRYMDSKGIVPRFEFGYGLSYTSFEYSDLEINSSDDSRLIDFTIKNTGDVDGTEIPQLYIGFPEDSGEPEKVLRGFDDVKLAKGESKKVSFKLTQKELSVWDTPSQSWKQPAGSFKVYVGASIKDIRLTGDF
ncbi:glycoside hydrolase family 3 protein [Marasmius fiardii PR-910]|nr:glycoside hydrolase family 3 protein [Marasmius fiardii PR-910]